MRLNTLLKPIHLFLLAAAFAGCSHSPEPASTATQDTLSDANIAAIVVGANKIDISAGKIALDRSTNPKVKEFAQRMVTDHQSVLDSAVQLATRLGVTPVDNDLVHTLARQSTEHEAKLKTLSGKEFDKTYIDHEVAYHEAVINVVKTQLIPGADNKELKDTLTSVLPAFDAHLAHSKTVQASLQ